MIEFSFRISNGYVNALRTLNRQFLPEEVMSMVRYKKPHVLQNMPSYFPIGINIIKKITKFLKANRQSLGTAHGNNTCVKRWTSCEAQTKMNDEIKMFKFGKPGSKTNTPFRSAANQMWYWQMNNSSEMRPNHAKNDENRTRNIPGIFLRTM